MLQLEVKPYTMPAPLEFNFEELKSELTEKIHLYETMVYTDSQIKEAKTDRANLNKLKDALNSERIRREKEYMEPFKEFKDKINELIGIISKPISIIDEQIKAADQKKKEEKREEIKALFNETGFPDYYPFEKAFNEAWLNTSCSMTRVKEDLKTLLMKNDKAVETINALPEYSFEALEIYKKTLDLSDAITKSTEMGRIAKAKKEAEEAAARTAELERVAKQQIKAEEKPVETVEENPEPTPGTWVKFEAFLTKTTVEKLSQYMKENGIAFRPIK